MRVRSRASVSRGFKRSNDTRDVALNKALAEALADSRNVRGIGSLWRDRDYVRLWGAQGISALGTQITLVALPLTAVLTLDASTFEVALLTGLEFVPFALLGIPAGVWVDRLRRRPIMIATDLARGACLISVPAAYWVGSLTLPHLYVVALVNGSLSVFFVLAYQAYVPSLVVKERLVRPTRGSRRTRRSLASLAPAPAEVSWRSSAHPSRCSPTR